MSLTFELSTHLISGVSFDDASNTTCEIRGHAEVYVERVVEGDAEHAVEGNAKRADKGDTERDVGGNTVCGASRDTAGDAGFDANDSDKRQ